MRSRRGWFGRILHGHCGENPTLYRKRHQGITPLQRIGEPDEIAWCGGVLASAAGSFTTGQTIVIDGGTTAGSVVSHDD